MSDWLGALNQQPCLQWLTLMGVMSKRRHNGVVLVSKQYSALRWGKRGENVGFIYYYRTQSSQNGNGPASAASGMSSRNRVEEHVTNFTFWRAKACPRW